MKKLFLIFVLSLISVFGVSSFLYAEDKTKPKQDDLSLNLLKEIRELKDREIGSIPVKDLFRFAERVSVGIQNRIYVRRIEIASFILPGLGQFKAGDPLSGALFLSGDILIVAGTLAGSYFLLPQDLRFDQLNYFTTPFSTIKSLWQNHSFVDYLPSMGVLAGGGVANMLLKKWAAAHAGRLARANIRDGKVKFKPELLFFDEGRWGIGLKFGLW
ncbi:MAG: hypothetical protein AB1798_03345 [Spirochaetota bacterium]